MKSLVKRELFLRLEAKVSFIYVQGRPRVVPGALDRIRIRFEAPRRPSKLLL